MLDQLIKIPPQSLDAEQFVVGALLTNPELYDSVAHIVSADDFYHSVLRETYRVIESQINQQKSVDVITISEALNREDMGLGQLAQLAKDTIRPDNAPRYAEVIREKSHRRKAISAARSSLDNLWDETGELSAQLAEAECRLVDVSDVKTDEQTNNDVIGEILEEIDHKQQNPNTIYGLQTGFHDLDGRIEGMEGGDLVIIAARPAMGKTTLALNIAEHTVIKNKKPFLVFSLEMSKKQLMQRSLASLGGIHLGKIRKGRNIQTEDWDKITTGVTALKNIRLIVEDKGINNTKQMMAKARAHKRKHPDLAGIVVDYLQLIQSDGGNRTEQVTNITRDLKQMAMNLGVPVIALSQLNRNCENRADKRPVISDLRDSGSIEQDADMIMFLYRDEVYNEFTAAKGVCEVHIAKFRNGETGTERLRSELHFSRFRDAE